MGYMGSCVISVKKLVNGGIRFYNRIGKWIVWDIWEINILPKCSSFQLYLQFFDKYYLALHCLFGLFECWSFQLYLHKQHNNAHTVHTGTQGKNSWQQCNKKWCSIASLGLQRSGTPKHRHFPTNTNQHRFRPTHINTKILPTPTKIHLNYGFLTLTPTHLMTPFPPTYWRTKKSIMQSSSPLISRDSPRQMTSFFSLFL